MRGAGKLRQEGRGYVIQDGWVVHFRFNVFESFIEKGWRSKASRRYPGRGSRKRGALQRRDGHAVRRDAGKLRREGRSDSFWPPRQCASGAKFTVVSEETAHEAAGLSRMAP
jgi:Protein of unknown function (DUF933)